MFEQINEGTQSFAIGSKCHVTNEDFSSFSQAGNNKCDLGVPSGFPGVDEIIIEDPSPAPEPNHKMLITSDPEGDPECMSGKQCESDTLGAAEDSEQVQLAAIEVKDRYGNVIGTAETVHEAFQMLFAS